MFVTTILAVFSGDFAHAEDQTNDNVPSFNAAVTSDYRYRGISQTRLQPALQRGFDYAHTPSGFDAGTCPATVLPI